MSVKQHTSDSAQLQSSSLHRTTPSMSSQHSRTSDRGSERSSTRGGSNPAVESAVTGLLVAIKQLLESLTLWSEQQMDEEQVSDVYVRLGNNFNAAVSAFGAFDITMAELLAVPDDLRNVLEQCLAEEPTPGNLELYLPTVREIITNLLQGLRGKQSLYRKKVSDGKSRSRRGESVSTHRSQLSRGQGENGTAGSRRNTPQAQPQSTAPRRQESVSSNDLFVGGFAPPPPFDEGGSADTNSERQSQSRVGTPQFETLSTEKQPLRQFTQEPPFPHPHPPPLSSERSSPPLPTLPSQTPPQLTPPQVPPEVKRYSLVDKPSPSIPPSIPLIIEEPSSPAEISLPVRETSATPPIPPGPPSETPAIANSLAALKKSDTLERRASKRFSSYNITKMTGSGPSRERSVRGAGNRKSMAASNALSPGDLDVLAEEEEPGDSGGGSSGGRKSRSVSRSGTPERPPVPPLPSTPVKKPESNISSAVNRTPEKITDLSTVEEQSEKSEENARISVFLQLGREVKKTSIEPGMTFSQLRVLFVDKFSYNPGLENFPAIYIRDPSSGVQYELEDIDEIKEKCLLSLNIEPLDQIKQHIDTQILTLSQDIKEIKTTITNQKSIPTQSFTPSLLEASPVIRPTDGRLAQVARRLSRIVGEGQSSELLAPQFTGQIAPQITGGSTLSEFSGRVVTDLKTQFDEVQNLRRDLAIMRQLYTDFMKTTKESLGTLRTQTLSVKQIAHSKVGGARGYIDSGKKKLDVRSQDVLTGVEKLQDTVERVKDDVLKRHITPKAAHLRNIKADMEKISTELESLKEHIKTIKPMWKKTWEEELQNIVEEQQFLTHQEEFLSDLLEDYKAVVEVYGHVEKVISIKGSTPKRLIPQRSLKTLHGTETKDGLSNVMMEIRSGAVDSAKRIKAIEESAKNRERELANRSDEFQDELNGFVGGKKLKMTGGAEEVDRVRQKKNDMALKTMFTGGTGSMGSESPALTTMTV